MIALRIATPPPAAMAQANRPPSMSRPWTPPGTDSLVIMTAEAKVRFQANRGDSIGGANYRAYELAGLAARRMLRAIGRNNMGQARAVEAVLDSLGLDTDIVLDSEIPIFAFLMVRNPYNLHGRGLPLLVEGRRPAHAGRPVLGRH